MQAETLKKAILQYAMQGKLVEQNPNNEPASVLLERIKAEKEQLIKDGKIKKEKPLPPITEDEIPYELPKGWEWVKLGELVSISTGQYDANHARENGEYAFFTCSYTPMKCDTYSYEGQGILLPGNGANVGLSIFYEGKFDAYQRTYVLQGYSNLFLKYIHYMLIGNWKEYNANKLYGGATPYIKLGNIENYPVALPPVQEQQRIVEKLEQILPLVEEYGKNEEKLSKLNSTLPDKIKQSILQHAVQGKLVSQNPSDEPASELLKRIKDEKEQLIKDGKIKKEKPFPPITEDEIPFAIPDSWEWTKIRNIAFVTKLAGFEYTKYINLQDNGEIPVIRAQNVKPFSLNLTNLKYIDTDTSKMLERSALTKPCLLMTFIGAGIGDVAIFDKNIRFHLAPNVAKIEFYNQNNNIDNKYAMYYLLSSYGKQEVFKFLKATAQPSLSMDTIREVMIPLPPLAEQQRIVDKVNKLMEFIETITNNNRLVKDSASNLLKSIEKKSLTEYSCKNSNTIDIKEKRAILSAKIISQLHEEQYFGAIKLEKIIYLCETHLKINLGGKYKQEAAGPHDAQARYEVEDILKNKKWFSIRKEQKNNIEVTKYTPLEKSNEISEIFNKVFSAEATGINNLLELFRGKNSDFCESVATLYAVWLNRLSNNLSCTDTDLIADFKAWSKQKARFYDSDLQDRILFMRRKNLIPDSNIK